ESDIRYQTQIGGHNVDAGVVFPLEGEPTGFAINELYWGLAAPFWLRDLRTTRWRWGQAIGERLQELAADLGRDDLTIAITGLAGVLRAPEGTAAGGTGERIRGAVPPPRLVDGAAPCALPRYV